MKTSKIIAPINTTIYWKPTFVFSVINFVTNKNILSWLIFFKQKVSIFNLHAVNLYAVAFLERVFMLKFTPSYFTSVGSPENKKLNKAMTKTEELSNTLLSEIDKSTQIDMALLAALKEQRARESQKKYEIEQLQKELRLLNVTPLTSYKLQPAITENYYAGSTTFFSKPSSIHSLFEKKLIHILNSENTHAENIIENSQTNRLQAEKVLREWENQTEATQTALTIRTNNH